MSVNKTYQQKLQAKLRRLGVKSQIVALISIGILGLSPLCYAQTGNSATSIEQVNKETQDLLKSIGSYTADKKDEAVEKAKEGLNNLDERIDALEDQVDEKWDKMNKVSRKEVQKNLKAMRKQRNQVAQWYGSMKTSSADAWDHMTEGFSEAYSAFESAWEKSEHAFDK